MANRLFIDDFEAAIISGGPNWYNLSSWPFAHTLGCSSDFIPFIEGLTKTTPGFVPHSGTRCLGIESITPPAVGNTVNREWDIDLNMLPLTTTNEIYISCWRFISTDFHVDVNDYSRLFAFFNDGSPNWYPDSSVILTGNPNGSLSMNVRLSDPAGGTTYPASLNPFPLPLGRWFHQEYYFKRDAVNGAMAFWIDGVSYLNITGIPTLGAGTNPLTFPAGERHSPTDPFAPYRQWLDDIEIYDGIPAGAFWNLVLNASPINVPITVNSVLRGNTPLTLSLPAGNHTVSVPTEVVA